MTWNYNFRETIIQNRFSAAGINTAIERKDYPEESIFVVCSHWKMISKAAVVGNSLDPELAQKGFNGFVLVRKVEKEVKSIVTRIKDGVQNPKATELAQLLIARSRTSEAQPSLDYVPDTAQNILTAITPRHHLILVDEVQEKQHSWLKQNAVLKMKVV